MDIITSASNKEVAKNLPRVSICIPTRNRAHFLRAAILSSLEQTFEDIEVIVIDNQSTDGTEELVHELADEDNRIQYIRNDSDIGLCRNFNRCLEHARGEYIKFLCSDDILLPICVEQMVKCLDEAPSASLVLGGVELIDEFSENLGRERYSNENKYVTGPDAIQRCLFGKNYIGPPTAVLFRAALADRGFKEELTHLIDLEMWFYLLEQGGLVSLSDSICLVRKHSGQLTNQNIRSSILVEDNILVFNAYREKTYIKPTFINRIEHVLRIAWRVWVSSKYLTDKRKNEILNRYSSKIAYYTIIPAVSLGSKMFHYFKNF